MQNVWLNVFSWSKRVFEQSLILLFFYWVDLVVDLCNWTIVTVNLKATTTEGFKYAVCHFCLNLRLLDCHCVLACFLWSCYFLSISFFFCFVCQLYPHLRLFSFYSSDHLHHSVRERVLSSFPHYGHSGIVESARELFMQIDGQPGDDGQDCFISI